MAKKQRIKTDYPGVYYIIGKSSLNGKDERIFYIRYRKNGKMIEERAGRQFKDSMTPAKASQIRANRISNKELNNNERRKQELEKKNQTVWTIDRLWQSYQEERKKNFKCRSSERNSREDNGAYENHLKKTFGDREPSELTPFEINKFANKLLETKTASTVLNVMGLLTRAVNYGNNNGLIKPTLIKVNLPRPNNQKTEFLTNEQIRKLIQTLDSEEDYQLAMAMKLALFTGMRRSEITNLLWQDVDLERGFIWIRNAKGKVDTAIPINKNAREILENHPRIAELVFLDERDHGIIKNQTDKFRNLRDKAGLPKDYRPMHSLRHTYASMLASSGKVDLYTLQKLMTHKDTKMTQRYAHLRDETLKKASEVAVDVVNEALNGGEMKKVG